MHWPDWAAKKGATAADRPGRSGRPHGVEERQMSRKRWMKWIVEEAEQAEFVLPWERPAKAERRRVDPRALDKLREAG